MATHESSLNIVITGASRGLGLALGRELVSRGDRLVLCSRHAESLNSAVDELRKHSAAPEQISGMPCEVSSATEMNEFATFAKHQLGRIDRWINNAGTAGEQKLPLWELSNTDISSTCNTNLTGALLGSAEAIRLMRMQGEPSSPRYHIFNLGFSSFGANHSRTPVTHKASKLGVAALSRHLAQELREHGVNSIGVHEIRPGLVYTDLLLRDTGEQTKQIIALLAERPEQVARVLAPQIRNVRGLNTTIAYRSQLAMLWRALRCMPALRRAASSASRFSG